MKNKKYIIGVFVSLAVVRILSSIFAPIADCDETYNYWEPLHLLMYGNGLQTWEYSPAYGLRSYFFVLLHSPIGFISKFMFFRKPIIFYLVRSSIGLMSALGETFFVSSIAERFTLPVATITCIFLGLSPGMFNIAQNFLPGTFSMIFLLFTFAIWLRLDQHPHEDNYRRKIVWFGTFCACVAVVVGWPFVIVCVLLIVLECFLRENFLWLIRICLQITALVTIPMVFVDTYLYKKPMFATYNLVMYNKGSGSEKYGVENWHFYFRNLFLAFNIVFAVSIVTPFLLYFLTVVQYRFKLGREEESPIRSFTFMLPYFIWLIFYSVIPHKEERFMAPIYPLLCFTAAHGVTCCIKIVYIVVDSSSLFYVPRKGDPDFVPDEDESSGESDDEDVSITSTRAGLASFFTMIFFLVVFAIFSFSRIFNMVKLYGAPLRLYGKLYWELDSYERMDDVDINVCVGKEWYRFGSSFFFPFENTKLRFVRSHFDGLLPKYFRNDLGSIRATISHIPDGMNDQNIEEMDRYVEKEECHYMIDFEFEGQTEERYLEDTELWEVLLEDKFLDVGLSKSSLARVFFIPWYSDSRNVFGRYFVLKNKKLKKSLG